MAYITVTTLADLIDPIDGKVSLREAVAQANAGDIIRFALNLEGGPALVLTQGELAITRDLTIDGDRNDDGSAVTIDGNANDRILNITGGGTDVTLRNLTLTNGRSGADEDGGAILLGGGHLTMSRVTVSESSSGAYSAGFMIGNGGGLFATAGSRVDIAAGRFDGNRAFGSGGAIAAAGDVKLTIRGSKFTGNSGAAFYAYGGAILLSNESTTLIEDSSLTDNGAYGGGAVLANGTLTVLRTTIAENQATYGGGINSTGGQVTISDSTIANNRAAQHGGGIMPSGTLLVRNSTITGNHCGTYTSGGLYVPATVRVELSNAIVAGNSSDGSEPAGGPDIAGAALAFSNGHNVFGSGVAGAVAGDRENRPAAAIFATIDPATGGGLLNPNGVVSLRNDIANPALTAADPLTASRVGQLGTSIRPQPANSLPDIGSIEINQPLSTGATANNDVRTGTPGGNMLAGLNGNDLLRGLGGADTLNAGDGSDVLDGGPGNNRLNGGTGVDLATFAFSGTGVVVDLSGTTDTAKRGSETDLLTSIEGAVGTTKADQFIGDAGANAFQGGRGRDVATGGGGRDSYDFHAVQDSPPGASNSDLITDFVPGQDVLDLARIDADPSLPGDQPFVWRGTAAFSGAPGEVRYVKGATTIVQATTDGDLAPDFEIRLTGNKTLTEDDVRL